MPSTLENLIATPGLRTHLLQYLDQCDISKLSITSKTIYSIFNSKLNYLELKDDINELQEMLVRVKPRVNKYNFHDKGFAFFNGCNGYIITAINTTIKFMLPKIPGLLLLSQIIKFPDEPHDNKPFNRGDSLEIVMACFFVITIMSFCGACISFECKKHFSKISDDDWQILLNIKNKYPSLSTNTITNISALRQNPTYEASYKGDAIRQVENLLELLKSVAIKSPLAELQIKITEQKNSIDEKSDDSDSEACDSYLPLLAPMRR